MEIHTRTRSRYKKEEIDSDDVFSPLKITIAVATEQSDRFM